MLILVKRIANRYNLWFGAGASARESYEIGISVKELFRAKWLLRESAHGVAARYDALTVFHFDGNRVHPAHS